MLNILCSIAKETTLTMTMAKFAIAIVFLTYLYMILINIVNAIFILFINSARDFQMRNIPLRTQDINYLFNQVPTIKLTLK